MRISGKLLFSGLCMGMLLTGCVATNTSSPVTNEGLAMNQNDSENQLNTMCVSVLSSTSTVVASAVEYTSPTVAYSDAQINSFISVVETAEKEVAAVQEQVDAFKPATAVEDNTLKFKNKIKDVLKDLSAFKNAAKAKDGDAINEILNQFNSDLDVIRQIA